MTKLVGIGLLVLIAIGLLAYSFGFFHTAEPAAINQEVINTDIKQASDTDRLLSVDTFKVNQSIDSLLVVIAHINKEPKAFLLQFSDEQMQQRNFFADKARFSRLAENAKLAMVTASGQIDQINLSSQLPRAIGIELQKCLSNISSSYLLMANAFSIAEAYGKNNRSEAYMDTFKYHLYSGMSLYDAAIAKIIKLK
jgi:hypothetical protein